MELEEIQDWHKVVAKEWSKRYGFSYESALKIIRHPYKREIFRCAIMGENYERITERR